MRYWHRAKQFEKDQFSVIWDWTYEDAPLAEMFDDSIFDIQDMEDRCNRHTDTHYVARVRFFYDGLEISKVTLGSCYAKDCDPEVDMNSGLSGYMTQLMEEAESEARERCAEMLENLKRDFLGIDTAVETV
jgi:hypothetical protein